MSHFIPTNTKTEECFYVLLLKPNINVSVDAAILFYQKSFLNGIVGGPVVSVETVTVLPCEAWVVLIAVGIGVGKGVGGGTSFSVGSEVGDGVGDKVVLVGGGEGSRVGSRVGPGVGNGVGDKVGLGVGGGTSN